MLFSINEHDARPVYLQIAVQVKEQITRGELKPGDELPSVRDLAESLGINMHTVRHAYNVLREQKIVAMRLGQGTRVAKLRSTPAGSREIAGSIGKRLEELISEAYLMGLRPDDFRKLVEDKLSNKGKQEDEI